MSFAKLSINSAFCENHDLQRFEHPLRVSCPLPPAYIPRFAKQRNSSQGVLTFEITLCRKGVDIFTIARLLGHSQIEVTKRHLPVSNDDLKNVFVNSPADMLE